MGEIPAAYEQRLSPESAALPVQSSDLTVWGRTRLLVTGCFWIAAFVLGLLQTWFTRHNMIADGISYLEIAANYQHGRWHDALNAYWSPLYSWVLALFFALFHPAPSAQLATLHVVNFLGFLLGLAVLEWLLFELVSYRAQTPREHLSALTLYVVGYTAHIFVGLFLVGIAFCSPDLLALPLAYALAALTVRMLRRGANTHLFVIAGLLFGLSYLARAAFCALSPFYLLAFFAILRRQRRAWLMPLVLTTVCFAAVAGPFIASISLQQQRFTIGESGRLNYSWEVDGAARWMHWQGEPGDIGKPLHPTTRISTNPLTYLFDNQLPGTYSPWYDPSYWYAGVKPHLKIGPQLRVLLYNGSYAVRLLLFFPLTLAAGLLLLTGRLHRWGSQVLSWWPILLPPAFAVLTYSLVFLDKRYVAGYLVLIWITLFCSLNLKPDRFSRLTSIGMQVIHTGFLIVLILLNFRSPVRLALADLAHHGETNPNIHALLADRFLQLGLRSGDKIAYLGVTFNADWTRLDNVRIVGEIPVTYIRRWTLFSSNVSHDDDSALQEFWKASPAVQANILQQFRRSGIRMAVTDGTFAKEAAARRWTRVLATVPPTPRVPDSQQRDQLESRYLWLDRTNR